jgi:hypothetical protein
LISENYHCIWSNRILSISLVRTGSKLIGQLLEATKDALLFLGGGNDLASFHACGHTLL